MNIENPMAFSFIMQDDIYLLEADKLQYSQPAAEVTAVAGVLKEPDAVYTPVPEASAPKSEAAQAPVAPKPQPVSFKYLGGHKKRFLIIAHYPQHDFMHETHLAALESTLGRLGVSRDDVAIFNRANHPDIGSDVIIAFFKPQKLLVLGKNSLPDGLTLQLNKSGQVNNLPALFTFSFDEMMDSVENKKAFWEQMKQF